MAVELKRLAEYFASKGYTDLAGGARILAREAESLGEHSLPPNPTPELQVEVVRFTPEAREALEERGYVVYELTGQSIATLRDAGRPFGSTWHEGQKFEALPSRYSQVAVNPKQLFLPDSNRKTFPQQEEMVRRFSQSLREDMGREDVEAVIGSACDYAEVTFDHFDATGNRLFGKDYNYDYTRTTTPTVGSRRAMVGGFDAGSGLSLSYWNPGGRNDNVWVSPLVVPTLK